MADYMSPGDAFSSSIAQTMMQRDQQARQAADFALKQQAEARLAKVQEAQIAEAQAALAEKRAEHQAAIDEKERNGTVKDVAAMVPGDIPDADLIERAKKHHVPIRLTAPVAAPSEPAPQGQNPPTALAENPMAPAPVNGPAGTGVLKDQPAAFAGTRVDVEKKKVADQISAVQEALLSADPGSDEYKQALMQYSMIPGPDGKPRTLPANLLKGGGTDVQPVYRQNPRTGAIEKVGEVPKGSHFMTEPAPKDTTAHDLAKSTAVGHVYDTAMKEIIDTEKPIKGHIDGINGLGSVLAQRTPAADSLIAPLVLKATVAGQGSGFRMTRAEIENVLHSRSKWQDLEVALNKWSADPSKALQVTDEQRTDLRTLAKAIRVKANEQMQAITTARHALDDAVEEGDSMKIRRIRTKLDEDLQKMNDEPKIDDNDVSARADRLLKSLREK